VLANETNQLCLKGTVFSEWTCT